jgi:quercetin dioxygenase-like cupin family protein
MKTIDRTSPNAPDSALGNIERDLPTELHDVFQVVQLTRGTQLQNDVGADLVRLDPHQTSQIHRHNLADTVLYMLDGAGIVVVDDVDHAVRAGDRITIRPAQFHGVRTADDPLTFISIQTPPILDEATGHLDLEPRST